MSHFHHPTPCTPSRACALGELPHLGPGEPPKGLGGGSGPERAWPATPARPQDPGVPTAGTVPPEGPWFIYRVVRIFFISFLFSGPPLTPPRVSTDTPSERSAEEAAPRRSLPGPPRAAARGAQAGRTLLHFWNSSGVRAALAARALGSQRPLQREGSPAVRRAAGRGNQLECGLHGRPQRVLSVQTRRVRQ